jgi:hypothetical protein
MSHFPIVRACSLKQKSANSAQPTRISMRDRMDLMFLSSQRHFVTLSGWLRILAYNISGSTLFASYRETKKIGSLKLSACKTSTRAPTAQLLQRQPLILTQVFLSGPYAVTSFTYKIPQAGGFMSVRKLMISTTT